MVLVYSFIHFVILACSKRIPRTYSLLFLHSCFITAPDSLTLFDSDAKAIGIDNRCSACISHDINDFVDPVLKSDKVISAFGGRQQMKGYKGTIAWSWTDDDGVQTKFRIPNSYYVFRRGKVSCLVHNIGQASNQKIPSETGGGTRRHMQTDAYCTMENVS